MNHGKQSTETATAAGVILPKYLGYLRVTPNGFAPQRVSGHAALCAIQSFIERKPRTV